jgi:hypothetical protein
VLALRFPIVAPVRVVAAPAMSVGVVKDGKLIYAKGFGVRSLKNNQPMDDNTLVGIASNSKGFTCTALAILADEGKINWDDKVTKYIPEFQMADAYVSQNVTIKDLVTHRAGLGLGQGDLMFFPEGGTISTEQLIHNIRYLKPAYSLRNSMEYNNIMFIVAGEIIHKISGKSWAEFIEDRIMKPVDKYFVGKCGEYGNLFILLHLQNYTHSVMSTFIGKYEAKADIKGRIFIPSVYRKLLPEGARERVVMRRDASNDCLVLYPEPVWNDIVLQLKNTLDEWNPEDQMLRFLACLHIAIRLFSARIWTRSVFYKHGHILHTQAVR